MRLSIKSTFDALIASVKFASNFTESPCSPVVTFPSFSSEGHGVRPPQGTPFLAIFLLYSSFFFFYVESSIFHTFMDQLESFVSYSHVFHSKMRLSIKSTFDARIGSVKFAFNFRESPCSPVVTFLSFGSEGHGVQPPQGDSVFLLYFCCTPVFFYVESSV